MNSITIITLIVVALLTIIIFALTGIAYVSAIRAYRLEVGHGKHDNDIRKEYRKKKCKGGLVGVICSCTALLALLGIFVTGMVYRANNESFTINNETVLVIKSGSMSKFYDDDLAQHYNYDTSLQFGVGDICVFETQFEMVEGEVYGYQLGDITVTHRLVSMDAVRGLCRFRGDANPTADALIDRSAVKFHYTGRHVPGIGAFILYAQSYFGIWSLCGMIGVNVSAEVAYYQIAKITKKRWEEIK